MLDGYCKLVSSICHLTSVHSRHDTRIFHKMCRSGLAHGFQVALVVADGKGNSGEEGILIHDVGRPKGRIDRMLRSTKLVCLAALSLDADLYHLHDPELMPIGVRLKRSGKRVIFDAHEDLPKQLLGKPYLNKCTRQLLSSVFSCYELHACRRFDGVIAATPAIRNKFSRINATTVDINNFPLLHELENKARWENKRVEVCYVGGISKIRGVEEVCRAIGLVQSGVKLNLVGTFSENSVKKAVKALPGWHRVTFLGQLDRHAVRQILSRSFAGLVTYHPLPNHFDAQPNKMFEYMSAGIPVIASDFPLWRQIIADNECGLLVDPRQPDQIAAAIDELANNPSEARRMGQNGRRAVEKRYNWGIEEEKLFHFYCAVRDASPAV